MNSSGVYGYDMREDIRMSMNNIGGGRGYGRRDDGRMLMNDGGSGDGRQGYGSRVSTWINPREHETRQMLEGRLAVYRCGFDKGIHNRDDRVRNGYCGVDGDDDYNNNEVRCVEDGISLMNDDDGYSYDRSGFGETRRLLPYRVNDRANGLGWRRGSIDFFRKAGRGIEGSSTGGFGYGGDLRRLGDIDYIIPGGRGMRHQHIDRGGYVDDTQQGRGSSSFPKFKRRDLTSSL